MILGKRLGKLFRMTFGNPDEDDEDEDEEGAVVGECDSALLDFSDDKFEAQP